MNILVPLDFSDASGRVLESAARLARGLGAHVILLHVFDPIATYVPTGASLDLIVPDPVQASPADDPAIFEERLKALAEPLRKSGLDVTVLAVVGLAADDILHQASAAAVDYIIMGSHGRGALYHLFSGSVVNAVLKRSKCPVVVVPVATE